MVFRALSGAEVRAGTDLLSLEGNKGRTGLSIEAVTGLSVLGELVLSLGQ